MKNKTRQFLIAASAWAGAIAALDVTNIIALPLPSKVVTAVALVPVISAAVVHTLAPVIEWLGGKTVDKIVPTVIGLLAVLSLSSCTLPAGWALDLRTPYGDATSSKGGVVTVAPKPIIIREK